MAYAWTNDVLPMNANHTTGLSQANPCTVLTLFPFCKYVKLISDRVYFIVTSATINISKCVAEVFVCFHSIYIYLSILFKYFFYQPNWLTSS